MPATPAIVKLIKANTYFVTLQSRLLSRYKSSNKSKSSSNMSSRRKVFPGQRELNEYEPYIELVDSRKIHVASHPASNTYIEHVAQRERPSGSGINMLVDLEVASTKDMSEKQSRS